MVEAVYLLRPMNRQRLKAAFILIVMTAALQSNSTAGPRANASALSQSAEILLGERLFQEPRFAQFFYAATVDSEDINQVLSTGDPQLDKTFRFFGLPPYQIPFTTSPFHGESFSCRSCHLVDEHSQQQELGMRSYTDFASRSPLPQRPNEAPQFSLRNSPVLVESMIPRTPYLLHFDGEFTSMDSLIIATLTGRNLGWKLTEYETASHHICKVIAHDNGSGEIAKHYGAFPYRLVFSGEKPVKTANGKQLILDKKYRLDVKTADCESILHAVANFIQQYLQSLRFNKDDSASSPYDTFLAINHLPDQAEDDETISEYSERLFSLINDLQSSKQLQFVSKNPNTENGQFLFHQQPYSFGETELHGLQIFLNHGANPDVAIGNCVACHPPPHFTDFALHNIGITQVEYEAMHGPGSFLRLPIPSLSERNQNSRYFLPASRKHPERAGIFRQSASKTNPMAVDLGAWNIFYNSDFVDNQTALYAAICRENVQCSNDDQALQKSIASFKTPTLRNLGHSAPYMHNGIIGDLHAVIGFYLSISENSRMNRIRNADPELKKIKITARDIIPLTQFLVALYEDYE